MQGDQFGDGDWGPFGAPLFQSEKDRDLSRVGVIDVGSNSVRMVVFDGAARSPAYFYNEKVMCGLGAGLSTSGVLNPKGRVRAKSAIARFVKLAASMDVSPLVAVATAAMREAHDGPEFVAEIRADTGLMITVIDGEEEARLSGQGVLLGWPEAEGLMCDIGGSSMEVAEISHGEIGRRATSALGPLKLADVPGGQKGLRRYIRSETSALAEDVPVTGKRLYLVGGSWRAFARLDMLRRGYPLAVLHEYQMTRAQIRTTIDWIENHNLAELQQQTGISSARMSLVPRAIEVLRALLSTFRPSDIAISSYGIREGLLYEQMPDTLRRRDPLIEACRFAEHRSARMPGFGPALFDFLRPLYKKAKYPLLRLVNAACLLHDVSWRAHPDYRSEVVFDIATQANLGGLAHDERIFLGMALLHRYKNSRAGSRFAPLFHMIPPEMRQDAETLGKAMRFGAMFAASKPAQIGQLRHYPKKKLIELCLTPENQQLYGEVAQARFGALAKSLDAVPVIKNAARLTFRDQLDDNGGALQNSRS